MNIKIPVKKVLMTADTVGGVWTYSVELIKSLKSYGIKYILAVMGAPLSSFQKLQIKDLDNVRLFESEFKLEWMENPWDDVKAAGRWLMDIAEGVDPDVIHLNGYAHASLPFKAPKLVVAHSCVFSWFKSVRNELPDDQWNRYRIEVSNGLQSADIVTAPSYSMMSVLKEYYGDFNSGEPVYNSVNPDEFIPQRKEPFILSAGRIWDEAKNINVLVNAAPEIKWPVYIAGDNYHPVNNNHISFAEPGEEPGKVYNNINCIGCLNRKKLSEYMSKASIFVLPALYEPFGLSILEAAYSGCALVLGNIPSLKEIWKDSAVFIDPENETELAGAINKLINDKELLKEYSSEARSRAFRFTPEIMAEKYFNLYNKLIRMKNKVIN